MLSWFYTEPESFMYVIFCLAIILFAAKSFGIIARRLGLPQVVGMCIAGLLIGPALFIKSDSFHGILNPNPEEMDMLHVFSQIGVLFILFSSGLDTNVKEMKKAGLVSTLIATAGVLVPLALGFVVTMFFMPNGWADVSNSHAVFNALFVGCILTATSVGITVETLRELGKLNTKVGTIVLSSAIIDDVLGILVLSVITSLKGGDIPMWVTFLKVILFFVFAIGVGLLMRFVFRWLSRHYPHHRRSGIYAIALCFIYAFVAEQVFGVAAITGAFMAGLMLSNLDDTEYINKKIVSSGYLIFSPIFFCFIGISADFSQFKPSDLIFALVFVIAGIAGKILGCGATAKATKHSLKDSYIIGSGMVARGEVALAVYAAGHSLIWTDAANQVVGVDPMVATICLIIFTSIACPILLKLGFRNKHKNDDIACEGAPSLVSGMSREGSPAQDLEHVKLNQHSYKDDVTIEEVDTTDTVESK